MAATKTNAAGNPVAKLAKAGPGQIPAMPQPIPKIAEPMISFGSNSFFVGSENVGSQTGFPLFVTKRNEIA